MIEQRDPAARPDPFALPSETTFRFLLLLVVTLAAGLFLSNWVFLGWAREGQSAALRHCLRVEVQVREVRGEPAGTMARERCRREELAPFERRTGVAMLGGAAAILGAGGLACSVAPVVRRRRRRLIALREDVPEVADAVAGLARECGLRRAPEPVWNPLDPGTGALVFGAFGRHWIALGAGLVGAFYRDRDQFDAVVRHELAHVRNGDVTLTYLAVFIWWAFLLVGVLPFSLSLFDEPAGTVLDLGWRLAVLAALVYLTRNAVLRARETYADARAAAWAGSPAALRALLRRQRLDGRPRLLRRVAAVHPSSEERARLLDDPAGLFRLRPIDALAAGLAAGIAFAELRSVAGLLVTGSAETAAPTLGALASVPLAIGVVVAGGWRAELLRPSVPTRAAVAGLALAGGLLLGGFVSPSESVRLPGDAVVGAVDLAWSATLAVFAVLFVQWLVVCASGWLRAVRSARGARWALTACWIVASAAFAWLVGQAAVLAILLEELEPDIRFVVAYVADKDVTLLVLAGLGAFPVAASLWAPGRAPGLPVRTAVAAAFGAGVLFLTVTGAWRAIDGLDASAAAGTGLYDGHEAIAVALQAVVACVVVVRGGAAAAGLGLLAALAAGSLAAGAFLGVTALGSSVDGSFAWETVRRWTNEGALFAAIAMPVALVARRGLAPRPARATRAILPSAEPVRRRAPAPRPPAWAPAALFAVLALAGGTAFTVLGRQEPAPEPAWSKQLTSLCTVAVRDVHAAKAAPFATTLVATRLRRLAHDVGEVDAPPAQQATLDRARSLLIETAAALTDAELAADPATSARRGEAAVLSLRQANLLLLSAGALECGGLGS